MAHRCPAKCIQCAAPARTSAYYLSASADARYLAFDRHDLLKLVLWNRGTVFFKFSKCCVDRDGGVVGSVPLPSLLVLQHQIHSHNVRPEQVLCVVRIVLCHVFCKLKEFLKQLRIIFSRAVLQHEEHIGVVHVFSQRHRLRNRAEIGAVLGQNFADKHLQHRSCIALGACTDVQVVHLRIHTLSDGCKGTHERNQRVAIGHFPTLDGKIHVSQQRTQQISMLRRGRRCDGICVALDHDATHVRHDVAGNALQVQHQGVQHALGIHEVQVVARQRPALHHVDPGPHRRLAVANLFVLLHALEQRLCPFRLPCVAVVLQQLEIVVVVVVSPMHTILVLDAFKELGGKVHGCLEHG
eukprot:m.1609429 g.1609429  ORF g.1609429 m.1609429 type:complete len:354 (+) comp25365_c0_seq1:3805-4866(+)